MALQLAIAAAIGIGVMVSSFRSSVEIWLGQRLAADLYVSAPRGWRATAAPWTSRLSTPFLLRQTCAASPPRRASRPLAGAAH